MNLISSSIQTSHRQEDACDLLKDCVNNIYFSLKNKKTFPPEKREFFNKLLNQIHYLAYAKENFQIQTHYDSAIIQHIWTYKFLHRRLEEIKAEIHAVTGRFFFHHKISSSIQPALINKIQALQGVCMSVGRIPISYGLMLTEVKNQAMIELSTHPDCIDTDTFHLSLSQCVKEELQGIDTYSLGGSNELYGLLRWHEILKQRPETDLLKKVLTAFDDAIKIATKTYLGCLLREKWLDEGVEYYETWATIANRIQNALVGQSQANLLDHTFVSRLPWTDQALIWKFLQQSSVDNTQFIPQIAFTSDVAHDIKSCISGLQADDFRFFCLGTVSHMVMVKISCVSPCTDGFPGDYTYQIFNTGSGVKDYHQTRLAAQRDYGRPWTVTNLSQSALNVEFFEKLVRYTTSNNSTSTDFYFTNYHFLIEKGKGILKEDESCEYALQLYGTCTYSCIEATLLSLLPRSEMKEIELLMLSSSTHKQIQAVRKRQREEDKSPKSPKRQKLNPESDKLLISQRLLEITQKRLQEAVEIPETS